MGYAFQADQWVPYPLEAVFAFYADPENLPKLMPEWQKARIEQVSLIAPPRAGSSPRLAGTGSRFAFSFRPFAGLPLRVHWETEITEFSLNSQFTDRQIKGPFASWTHTHRIRSVDRAGINITVIVDQVEYEPAMGLLGRIADALFLRKLIERAFAYRQARLTELLSLQLKPVIAITHQQPQSTKSGKLTA